MKPILAAAAFFLAALPAFADETPPTPTLAVSGEATEMVVPDIVVVTLGVLSQARTAKEALAANSADMAKVIKAVTAAGVKEVDVGTTDFSVNPVYAPNRSDQSVPPTVIGYQVSNQVRVTIRDLANSGTVLDQVIGAGANQVNSISFDLADPVTPAGKALRAAIADAKTKAELMADAAGVRLVRILSLSTGEAPQPRFAAVALAAKAVPIMAGQRAISANATIVFEIAPK